MKTIVTFILIAFLPSLAFSQKKNESATFKVNIQDKPRVSWETYDKDTVTVALNTQTINAVVQARTQIKEANIIVNDRVEETFRQNDFKAPDSTYRVKQVIEKVVNLRTGSNRVRISVETVYGTKVFSERIVLVDPNLINVLRNEKDVSPPMVYVSNPPNIRNDRVRVYEDGVMLRGMAIDESGVMSVEVNKTRTPIKPNGSFSIYLPLVQGDNYVSIEVKDINQLTQIKRFVINKQNMGGEDFAGSVAKNYLVVIGINDYESWPKLNNAVKDATDVKSVLIKNYNFEDSLTSVLLNRDATREKIYNILRDQIEKVSSRDNLVIYFSGHGYFDKLVNEGYWVPIDASKSTIDYIPNSQILKIIENINSQHTFLVADACFSGSLFSSTNRGFDENVEKFKSRWGLASGRLEAVSDGDAGVNSPFASSFIQFLEANKDEKFPITDLIQYVKKTVAELSNQTPIGNPLKNVGDEGGELVLYRKKK